MSDLAAKTCEPCRRGAPAVTAGERERLHKDVPDWKILNRDGVDQLERTFAFPDFADALEFTTVVGAVAEEEGHHPVIVTEWGKVTVTWWTHKIGGLHENDFIMAAKTDELFDEL